MRARQLAGALLVLGLLSAQAPIAPDPSAAASYKLDGFRSAQFGMTDAQLRQAIRKDFSLGNDRITVAESPVDRTTVLTVTARDLLPNSGPAQVAYVLGFAARKLIQVTVTWGGAANPQFKPETAVAMANQLRNYFVGLGYKSDTLVLNTRMADGSFVVFRGFDVEERMTILTLAGADVPEGATNAPAPLLSLSYVLDVRNPDIYRIPRGQF